LSAIFSRVASGFSVKDIEKFSFPYLTISVTKL